MRRTLQAEPAVVRDEGSGLAVTLALNDTTTSSSSDLAQIESLLKLSKSIEVELVPGSDNYLDMKGFTWQLASYKETSISLKFTFEHPEYISVGKPDTIKVTYSNAEAWISPQDPNIQGLPQGYTTTFKVKPQGVGLLSEEEVEQVVQTGQNFVIANLVLSQIFKQVMNMLLGSIIMIQILAHLPLADINLPANALQ